MTDAVVMREVVKALRNARKYRGSWFGDEELEYAALLLGEELPYYPIRTRMTIYGL